MPTRPQAKPVPNSPRSSPEADRRDDAEPPRGTAQVSRPWSALLASAILASPAALAARSHQVEPAEVIEPAPRAEPGWREQLIDAAEAVQERARAAWEDVAAPADPLPTTFGLHVYDPGDGTKAPAWWGLADRPLLPERVVVLVHGLDEPGGIWTDAAAALAGAGHAVVRFDYPNDQAVADSASDLDAAFLTLDTAGAKEVVLVGHSMGGLVSLDAATRPAGFRDLAELRVSRLITVGTPYAGSPWARVRGLGEARDRVLRWLDTPSWDPRPIFDIDADGDGSAGRDLMPGSDYLTSLATRTLPADLAITAIAGLAARTPTSALEALASEPRLASLIGQERAATLGAAIRDAGDDLGDGLVSLESALPEFASDKVVVEANHRSLLACLLPGCQTPPAIPIILDRLALDAPAAQPATASSAQPKQQPDHEPGPEPASGPR